MSTPGKLYLLPVPIAEADLATHFPQWNLEIMRGLKYFIAEDGKTARRNLKLFGYPKIEEAEILLLNEHSRPEEIPGLLKTALEGENVGLMSDAGCPGIADPGAEVVRLAHQKGIEVVPLVGPSSIVLSIMASGFNGQNFAFVGYLPIERPQKQKRLRELEQIASKKRQAQFFIETPYRNEQLFELMLETLSSGTRLFLGKNITAPSQLMLAKTVAEWKKSKKPELHKVPVVFGLFG